MNTENCPTSSACHPTGLKQAGKNYITKLASDYLLTEDPTEKRALLFLARNYMEDISSDISAPKILKEIGVSYFGGVNSSQKTEKGKKLNYDTYILYLSPASVSGVNVCKFASDGCRAACLVNSGRALMAWKAKGVANDIAISRLKKTWLVVFNRKLAEKVICHELKRESEKAFGKGHKFSARLNGTSDLFFGRVIRENPEIQFYDYTKNTSFLKLASNFENWHLTFSFSGINEDETRKAMAEGFNIAVPVVGKREVKSLIESGHGFSMDETDLRFLDKGKGEIGILSVKQTPGTQKGIEEGFLISSSDFLSFADRMKGESV